ncbi:MAG: alpha/beta fold hydrolase, partial [Burkholderiales bacterium]
MVEITYRFISANGLPFHCATAGELGRPLIVFLHGFPEFWYAWRAQLAEFGRDRLAVAPDQRGYDLSDKPGGVAAYRVNALIEDLRQLAAAF